MDSLTTSPVAGVLEAEAEDYKGPYRQAVDNFLSVTPEFGRLLYICARTRNATRVVEFGTSFGISTIHLACALRDNGGGTVIGTELEPTKAARAQEHLNAAGLAEFVDIRVGDALDTLRDGAGGPCRSIRCAATSYRCSPVRSDPPSR